MKLRVTDSCRGRSLTGCSSKSATKWLTAIVGLAMLCVVSLHGQTLPTNTKATPDVSQSGGETAAPKTATTVAGLVGQDKAATGVAGFYSVWPYFAGMTVILLFACSPLLKQADAPLQMVPARVHTIDGLRGFLAFGVVFHHAAIYHLYLKTGKWELPPSHFYAELGHVGVAMFFMITGYLFWTQMLKAGGKPNLAKLYLGRVFRIVPLYLFLVVVILLTVGVLTRWQLREPPVALVKQVAKWLAGGVVIGGDINGYVDTGRIAAGVTWTLHYEWIFYASLLVTSFFARKFIFGILLPVIGLLVAAPLLQFHPNNLYLTAALMFCAGMTVASAKKVFVAKPHRIPQWALSTGFVGCLASVWFFKSVYHTIPILILAVAFALIVFGATLFGLLLSRPAKRLGDISYGIYLLQGPIFSLMFAPSWVRSFAIQSAWVHWGVVLIAALALVMVATATHALIERPGIQAGQWVWSKIAPRRRQSDPERALSEARQMLDITAIRES
jgi:peptidoglycan/LPS O-acetylase OafA/YrhL